MVVVAGVLGGVAAVVSVACPVASSVTEPIVVAPSLNVTVPVGVPAPGAEAVTVAVKVTDCPETDGLTEEASAVAVAALLTIWLRAAEVLVVKLPSPP